MRLLLDEHLSGRRIGTPLRRRGHDVEALDADPETKGLSDEKVLERASAAGRIVVTRDGADFIELARAWADEKRNHAGILVVWGQRSTAPGAIVAVVHARLLEHPDHDVWVSLVLPA